jgi:hypothetical protein
VFEPLQGLNAAGQSSDPPEPEPFPADEPCPDEEPFPADEPCPDEEPLPLSPEPAASPPDPFAVEPFPLSPEAAPSLGACEELSEDADATGFEADAPSSRVPVPSWQAVSAREATATPAAARSWRREVRMANSLSSDGT